MTKNGNNLKNENALIEILSKTNMLLFLIIALLLTNLIINVVNVTNTWNLRSDNVLNDSTNNDEETYDYDVSKFTEVNYDGFKKLMKDKDTSVIYIGRETCSYCAMFIPTMVEAQEKYDFKTYYFDITRVFNFSNNSVVDEKAYNELSTYNDFFEENFLATPMVVIFKDGKYVGGTIGYQDINRYSTFLEENGIKK